MSREYAERRIGEALRLAHGNALRAHRQIVAWAYEDARLLQALTKPHLNGIVAYNIERVASGRSEKAKTLQPLAQKKPDTGADDFGMEILNAVADSNAAVFGLDSSPPQKKGASQAHVDAIYRLAQNVKTKK